MTTDLVLLCKQAFACLPYFFYLLISFLQYTLEEQKPATVLRLSSSHDLNKKPQTDKTEHTDPSKLCY